MTIANIVRRLIAVGVLVILSAILFISAPVWAAPVILPSTLPEAEVGVSYTATLVAAPVTPPSTWTITSGSLPGGLTLNAATGTISGTPTTTGSYTFFVEVADATSPPSSPQQGFLINVTQTPLSFLTTTLPDATEDSSYSQKVNVTGGTSPYTWSIVSGSLPDGLTLKTTTGVISGTPDDDTTGSYSFSIRVTDSSTSTLSTQHSFSLFVREGTFESVISVASGLASGEANVFVEGEWVAALGGGESVHLSLDLGSSQTITVDDTVSNPTNANVRFVVEDDSIEVRESSPDAHFSYNTEYLLAVTTAPSEAGQVTDSDWYSEGDVFTITAPSQVEDTSDTRYRFSHWQLPTGGNGQERGFELNYHYAGKYYRQL